MAGAEQIGGVPDQFKPAIIELMTDDEFVGRGIVVDPGDLLVTPTVTACRSTAPLRARVADGATYPAVRVAHSRGVTLVRVLSRRRVTTVPLARRPRLGQQLLVLPSEGAPTPPGSTHVKEVWLDGSLRLAHSSLAPAFLLDLRGELTGTVTGADVRLADTIRSLVASFHAAYGSHGHWPEVEKDYWSGDDPDDDCPSETDELIDEAWDSLQREYLDDAVDRLSDVIDADAEHPWAYFLRGHARACLGDLPAARVDFDHALRLNPDFALAFLARGVAREEARDFEGAVLDYTEALRVNPGFVAAYLWRGRAWQSQGNLGRAVHDFSAALDIKEDCAEAYLARGAACLRLAPADLDDAARRADGPLARDLDLGHIRLDALDQLARLGARRPPLFAPEPPAVTARRAAALLGLVQLGDRRPPPLFAAEPPAVTAGQAAAVYEAVQRGLLELHIGDRLVSEVLVVHRDGVAVMLGTLPETAAIPEPVTVRDPIREVSYPAAAVAWFRGLTLLRMASDSPMPAAPVSDYLPRQGQLVFVLKLRGSRFSTPLPAARIRSISPQGGVELERRYTLQEEVRPFLDLSSWKASRDKWSIPELVRGPCLVLADDGLVGALGESLTYDSPFCFLPRFLRHFHQGRALDDRAGVAAAAADKVPIDALLATMKGEWQLAIASLDEVILAKPNHLEAYSYRAGAHLALGAAAAALHDLDTAIRLNPHDASLYFDRTRARLEMLRARALHQVPAGERDAIMSDLASTLDLNPLFVHAHLLRGTLLGGWGQWQDALADFDAAITIKGDYAEAYLGRGRSRQGLRAVREAADDLERAAWLAKRSGDEAVRLRATEALGQVPGASGVTP